MPRFKATWRGLDIFSYHLPPLVKYTDALALPLTAHWHGMPWEDFKVLETDEQEFLIAVYKTANQLDAVQSYYPAKRRKSG